FPTTPHHSVVSVKTVDSSPKTNCQMPTNNIPKPSTVNTRLENEIYFRCIHIYNPMIASNTVLLMITKKVSTTSTPLKYIIPMKLLGVIKIHWFIYKVK